MKQLVLIILMSFPSWMQAQSTENQKKILMVVSSYGKDDGAIRPGYEFDEFSQAYLIFKNNRLSIDVASPKGGEVTADQFNKEKSYNQSVLSDEHAMELLANTLPTSAIDPDNYDAIYVVGGKGAMFDLPYDPSLQDILQHLYRKEGTIISAVCHGPAAFVNVKDNDEYIIKGIELTSFCNAEEELFGKKWVKEFPFQLEDQLIARGATFTQTDFMLSKVSVSGKFVTGQNPFSTTKSAEAVVKALGLTPAMRTYYQDENSVYLIMALLDETTTASQAEKLLKKQGDNYDLPLIAVYGYYKILAAKELAEKVKGIQLVELTSPYFFNENLQLLIAKTYIELEDENKAKDVLTDLIEKDLLTEQATKLLTTLD